MSTLLKMQKIHPLCSRCIRMYPLQNRWTVLRYLQCYENFSECCTHLILPETALFSPTPTFAKEPKYLEVNMDYKISDELNGIEILDDKEFYELFKRTWVGDLINTVANLRDTLIREKKKYELNLNDLILY